MSSTFTYALNPGWRILLRDMGVVPERVLRRAGLPLDLLNRGAGRLSVDHFHAMWQGLEAEVGRERLPLLLVESMSVEVFDPALFAAVCCPDLRSSAQRISRYKSLIGPIRLDVDEVDLGLRLTMSWPAGVEPPDSLGEMELLFWVGLVRLATRTPASAVAMMAPRRTGDLGAIEGYAGAALEEGPSWSITFSELDAARPFLTANEGMWQFFEPELRRRLAQLGQGATTSERVRAVLLELLPSGDASAEAVARRLAMSKRTLQRRLKSEDSSYQLVLDETRESLARHYLQNSPMSAAEISFLLGYEDPNSFYRAFHAWTGETPEAVRLAAAK